TAQNIELSCATSGAVIRYTEDGSEPTESSTLYSETIPVSSSTTIRAKAFKTDWLASDTATGEYTITGTVAKPVFFPDSGTYPTAQNIELSCATSGAVIRYTTDGREPTESSTLYSETIPVSSSTTIRARAFKTDWLASDTATGEYTITGTVAGPVFLPEPGAYPTAQNVELSCFTPGADIRYTTNSSEPTETSPVYSQKIPVGSNMVIKAKAYKKDWTASSTASGTYTITGTVDTPVFSPAPGTYTTPRNVELSCSTPGAIIRFTTDGNDPTEYSQVYTAPVLVSSATTIKAKAFKENWTASSIATGNFIITGAVVTPTFSPVPGTYTSARDVELLCLTPGAAVHYTTDGTEPSESSPVYTIPVHVSSNATIKAKAFKPGWTASVTATGTYKIIGTVEKTVLSPGSGVYANSPDVEISCPTPGATIHYTTDGSEPGTSSQVYSSAIHVSGTTIIKAKAFKPDWYPSGVTTEIYTITETVENPVFSPAPGTYTANRSIELSCATPGAYIHYTTDGTEPTEYSNRYTNPIFISSTTTIKAKAYKTEWNPSVTTTGFYKITEKVETPVFSTAPGKFSYVWMSCPTSGATVHYTTDGTEPSEDSPEYLSPVYADRNMTIRARAFKDDWNASDIAAWVFKQVDPPAFSLDSDVYTSPKSVELSCATPDSVIRYTTDGSTPKPDNSQVYSSPIYVSENMTIKANAFKDGWVESETATASYIITVIENSGGGACFINTLSGQDKK
ncbi:MAG: hypothetical protein GY795_30820, partial [Desulfobacterales bacterium]|nr:hypothetical protein [Desulfobacterales bacterium]